MAQHREAGIAGDAACGGCREVDAGCLLNDRQAGVGARCRGRGLRGRRAACGRFRGNVRRGSGRLSGEKSLRVHVHRHLEAITGVARVQLAGQRALGHQPQ